MRFFLFNGQRRVLQLVYIIKLFAHLYLDVYTLAIAGQTAGPNGLTFFEGTLEYTGEP